MSDVQVSVAVAAQPKVRASLASGVVPIPGPPGPAGPRSPHLHFGLGSPHPQLAGAVSGDHYIDVDTGDCYTLS